MSYDDCDEDFACPDRDCDEGGDDEDCDDEGDEENDDCDDEGERGDEGEGSYVTFADPGGNSALRAASKRNPRDRPCPTCKTPNVLTPADVALGYQCDRCADRDEGGGYGRGDY